MVFVFKTKEKNLKIDSVDEILKCDRSNESY